MANATARANDWQESRPPDTSLGGVWVGYAVRQLRECSDGNAKIRPAQTGKLSGIPCIGFPSLRPFALGKGLESRSNGGSRSGSRTAPVGGNHPVMPGGGVRR